MREELKVQEELKYHKRWASVFNEWDMAVVEKQKKLEKKIKEVDRIRLRFKYVSDSISNGKDAGATLEQNLKEKKELREKYSKAYDEVIGALGELRETYEIWERFCSTWDFLINQRVEHLRYLKESDDNLKSMCKNYIGLLDDGEDEDK